MTHPLIARLIDEHGYACLKTMPEVDNFVQAPGLHAIFIPGDVARNLETLDVAVILPELRSAFQGRFDCAVATDAIESALREATGVFKTPSLLFYRTGTLIDSIPKVRDWSDYIDRITHIISDPVLA